MNFRNPRYVAYLLRLWQGGEPGSPVWRVSLQDAHTGERYGFADLDALLRFLLRRTRGAAEDEANVAHELPPGHGTSQALQRSSR